MYTLYDAYVSVWLIYSVTLKQSGAYREARLHHKGTKVMLI